MTNNTNPRDYDKYSFANFCNFHYGKPFRYLVYRRMFTPYEQDKKFSDESVYEDIHYKIGCIREISILPDGDVLLGFVSTDYSKDEPRWYEYYKLSEIRLERYEGDELEQSK